VVAFELAAILALALIALMSAVAYDRAFVRRRARVVAAEIDRMAAALESTTGRSELPPFGAHDPQLQRALDGLRTALLRTATESITDPLTGCLNRQAVLAALAEEIARAERYTRPLSIGLIEDPAEGVSGPLWLRGGIPLIAADGFAYEVRNRMTLCRCGASKNKPFCDGTHITVGFRDCA